MLTAVILLFFGAGVISFKIWRKTKAAKKASNDEESIKDASVTKKHSNVDGDPASNISSTNIQDPNNNIAATASLENQPLADAEATNVQKPIK